MKRFLVHGRGYFQRYFGDARDSSPDLSLGSRMLYHWATSPSATLTDSLKGWTYNSYVWTGSQFPFPLSIPLSHIPKVVFTIDPFNAFTLFTFLPSIWDDRDLPLHCESLTQSISYCQLLWLTLMGPDILLPRTSCTWDAIPSFILECTLVHLLVAPHNLTTCQSDCCHNSPPDGVCTRCTHRPVGPSGVETNTNRA